LKGKHDSEGKQAPSNTINIRQEGVDPSITINSKHVVGPKAVDGNEIQQRSQPKGTITIS
jgi:hypothetical protein